MMNNHIRRYIGKTALIVVSLFIFPIFSLQAQITDTIVTLTDVDINRGSYSNYEGFNTIYVGDQDDWRGLIFFDLSAIPENALITNASVILRTVGGDNQTLDVSAFRVTSQWSVNDANWYDRTATTQWNTYGGDYNSTLPNTIAVSGLNNFHSWNVTSAVQDWIDGTYTNYGLIFRQFGNSANHVKYFASSEYSIESYHPRLVITYTTTIDSLWLRANYGTNTTVDGAAISQWTNVYANNSFYQDNTAYRPVYRSTTNLINFNPTVQFDGTNDFLKGTLNYGIFGQNSFTTFSVVKSIGSDKYIWGQHSYRTNSASHSIATQQRIGAFTLFRNGTNTIPITPVILGTRRTASNNFHLFYNGTNESNGSITGFNGSFIGNNLLLASRGGAPSNTLNGSIAEMMIFNRSLTDAEVLRINSYLATKYGISMTTNYVASNGTVYWNLSTDNDYNNAIFGLARDNGSTLHQQISGSTSNPFNFLTLSTDNNFLLPNAQHTAIANNLSFFMVGSNSSNDFMFQFNEFNSNIYSSRIDYEWLVQSTNFNQPVNLKFQDCGSTEMRIAYLIKKNGNSNFNSGTTEVGTLDSNGVITGVILNDDDYFTVFFKNLSPGGVNDQLKFWVKADYGTILSGAAVVQWKDIAGNFYLNQSNNQRRPLLVTNGQNFNPTISFRAANKHFFERNVNYNIFTNSYSIYIVGFNRAGQRAFLSVNQSGGSSLNSGILIEASDPSTLRFLHRNPPSLSGGDNLVQPAPLSSSRNNLMSFYRNSNVKHKFWVNGESSFQLSPTNTAFPFGVFTDLTVGRLGSEDSRYLDGEIAEIIIFNNENEFNRVRIESYLATKYGISINDGIGVNYIASDSTTIFWNSATNVGFNHDIFGIGFDEISTLLQKQSRSVNQDAFFSVYLLPSVSDPLPITNQLNFTLFEADKSFLMFGNNNDSLNSWVRTVPKPTNIAYRIKRVWKVQKTGTINNAVIAINANDLPANTGTSPLFLLVSNSPDMSGADYYPMTLVGTTWRISHNLPTGSYLSFGYGLRKSLRHGKSVLEGVRFPYQ